MESVSYSKGHLRFLWRGDGKGLAGWVKSAPGEAPGLGCHSLSKVEENTGTATATNPVVPALGCLSHPQLVNLRVSEPRALRGCPLWSPCLQGIQGANVPQLYQLSSHFLPSSKLVPLSHVRLFLEFICSLCFNCHFCGALEERDEQSAPITQA